MLTCEHAEQNPWYGREKHLASSTGLLQSQVDATRTLNGTACTKTRVITLQDIACQDTPIPVRVLAETDCGHDH